MVRVIGYRDKVSSNEIVINTTSRSNNWSKGLSPFFLGKEGILLYGDFIAKNVENAWQFSKLYKEHADKNGEVTEKYFEWAKKGWNSEYAYRYPMGKGNIPICSIWNGKKLDYIEARKEIYLPIYAKEVVKTKAYDNLQKIYNKYKNITLLDFDGYDYKSLNMDFCDVINNKNKKMGHAFVLAMLLEEKIIIKNNNLILKFDINKDNLNDDFQNISFFD